MFFRLWLFKLVIFEFFDCLVGFFGRNCYILFFWLMCIVLVVIFVVVVVSDFVEC